MLHAVVAVKYSQPSCDSDVFSATQPELSTMPFQKCTFLALQLSALVIFYSYTTEPRAGCCCCSDGMEYNMLEPKTLTTLTSQASKQQKQHLQPNRPPN